MGKQLLLTFCEGMGAIKPAARMDSSSDATTKQTLPGSFSSRLFPSEEICREIRQKLGMKLG